MSASFVPNPRHPMIMAKAVQEGLNAFLLLVSTGLYHELSQPGTGRRYPRGRRRKGKARKGRNKRAQGVHVASAPGQPPAVDTGALRRSWQVTASAAARGSAEGGRGPILRRMKSFGMVGYRLGSPLPYARIDSGWGRVKARPYISPVLADAAPSFPQIMAVAIRRHFPEGGPR